MSRTISGGTTGPVVLGTADNPLYITSTGTVTSTGSADGIDGATGTTWTITNAGVVSASGGNGVSLASSGIVSNTGSISGKDALVLRAGGSVTNNLGASISGLGALGGGLGSGAGVYITGAAGTVANHSTISGVAYGVGLGAGGLVTNTSSITGGEDGVIVQGAIGTIANSGNILATVDDGVALFAGGSVTNASGASISGLGTLGAGVFITGGVGTVTNAGSITEPNHHGVLMAAGGSLSNAASGSISALGVGVFFQNQAGTLTNAGFITGTGTDGTGIYLENGGSATNSSTGTITGHKFGAFEDGGFTTLANYGSISGATYDGAVLGLGGIVTNAAGASISGASVGVYIKYRAAGTVTNSGNISASGTGSAGIDLADGGVVTNNSTGSVSGNSFGVFVTGAGGTVANAGSIASAKYGGVELVKGGSVTNSAGGSIKGGSIGVYAGTGASGTVTNSGSIDAANASGAGIDLAGGGSITNNSGGSISGTAFGVFSSGALATVSNSGSISGSHGVGLEAGGSVTNAASASISGQVAGVFAQGGAATLSNAGSISATAGTGADIEGGGNITNLAGATISGSAFGIFLSGGSGTVTNAGTISGGTYAIDFAGSGTNRLVVDPGAVFVGQVTGGSGTSTLELANGTGSIGGVGTGSFNNFKVLAVDAGATWTLNGADIAPTVLDNGTVSIAGSLDVSTAIDASSTGLFQLGSGATLEVAAATGTTTQINFQDSSSELIIDNAALFGTNVGTASYAGPQLQHYVPGDKIDLKNFSSVGVTLNYNASTGVLQVSNSANQVASLDFQTSSLGGTAFAAASDGATGIFITDPQPSTPSVSSIAASGAGIINGNGDLNAGKTVTLTVNFSSPVTVDTTVGIPTLALNDGGSATYTGGSGTSAIAFSYMVASGQNTSDLVVSSLNLNRATIQDGMGDNADLSGAINGNPAGILQVDTTAPGVPAGLALDTSTDSGVKGDGITNFTQVKIDGTADAGSTVTLYDTSGTTVLGSGTADATTGAFSIVTSALANGTHSITAKATDGAGNISAASAAYSVIIDTTAPAAPTALALDASTDSGTLGDRITDFAQVKIDGKAEAGSSVTLYDSNGTTVLGAGTADATGAFSITTSTLSNGTHSITANATDPAGNVSAGSTAYAVTVDATAPTVSSIATSGAAITNGNGDLNAGKVVTLTVSFSEVVTVNMAGGSPTLTLNDGGTATYTGGSGTKALAFSYTVAAGQNTSDLVVSAFNLSGATIFDVAANSANLAGATNYNPAGMLQIDTKAPTITINTIAGDNIVNATEASSGFAIRGTTVGVENGRIVTVKILNSANTIVDTYTATDNSNAWSVNVTSAQATALADGSYTVIANVSDKAGNLAPTATGILTVDEDKLAEVPTLTISNTSPTVPAGGSVALEITATPVDSDDKLSVKISGVPSYESITAPAGDAVTSSLQLDGTYTWAITEGTPGTPLTGLTLASHYTGTGHPTATLTVMANNTTSGEAAASVSQSMTVVDPPLMTSSQPQLGAPSNPEVLMTDFGRMRGVLPADPVPAAYTTLAGLLDQYMAGRPCADASGMCRTAWTAPSQAWLGDRECLASPRGHMV